MWLMLQQDQPGDYVIATGEQHSVREFVEEAFSFLDLDYHNYIKIDSQLMRPTDVETLLGDARKAKRELGWSCTVSFKQLIHEMVSADLALFRHPQG
jgi:GDPmannose 4,6-dehydratase